MDVKAVNPTHVHYTTATILPWNRFWPLDLRLLGMSWTRASKSDHIHRSLTASAWVWRCGSLIRPAVLSSASISYYVARMWNSVSTEEGGIGETVFRFRAGVSAEAGPSLFHAPLSAIRCKDQGAGRPMGFDRQAMVITCTL